MSLRFTCKNCGKRYKGSSGTAGGIFICRRCGAKLRIGRPLSEHEPDVDIPESEPADPYLHYKDIPETPPAPRSSRLDEYGIRIERDMPLAEPRIEAPGRPHRGRRRRKNRTSAVVAFAGYGALAGMMLVGGWGALGFFQAGGDFWENFQKWSGVLVFGLLLGAPIGALIGAIVGGSEGAAKRRGRPSFLGFWILIVFLVLAVSPVLVRFAEPGGEWLKGLFGQSPQEALLLEALEHLDAQGDIWASVKDEVTMRAAAEKLKAWAERAKQVEKKARELGAPSKAEDRRLMSKHGDRLLKVTKRVRNEVTRVLAVPESAAFRHRPGADGREDLGPGTPRSPGPRRVASTTSRTGAGARGFVTGPVREAVAPHQPTNESKAMSIRFTCKNCGKRYKGSSETAGGIFICRRCGAAREAIRAIRQRMK